MNKILIAVFLLIITFSCVKEIDNLNFEKIRTGISIPVGSFRLNANSLTQLGDSLEVQQGEFNVIEFLYETELVNTPLNDRFTIKDQLFNDQIPFNSFVFVAGQTNEVKLSEYNSFTISNSDLPSPSPSLKKVVFKGGNIRINQSKDFDHNVETVISFPTLTKNGLPYTVNMINTGIFDESLDGYELNLSGQDGTSVNTIDYEISTTISNTGSSTTGTLFFGFNMGGMEFSLVQGDFQSYQFEQIEGEFNLGLPETDIPDNVGFTNPKIELIADNSAGINFGMDIDLISVTKSDGSILEVTGSYNQEIFLLDGASSPGEIQSSSFSISKDNTDNLVELISIIPQKAYFKGTAIGNPGSSGVNDNFITDESKVVINAKLTLPLEGYANNYAIIDTLKDVDLTFDDDGGISLDEVKIKLEVENNFPIDIKLQLYFLDEMEQVVLDSMFLTEDEQRIFASGNVGSNGLVTESTINSNEIGLNNEKYERIKSAKHIKIVAKIFTPGADQMPRQGVKFTLDNYFSLGIGISATALIDPEKL